LKRIPKYLLNLLLLNIVLAAGGILFSSLTGIVPVNDIIFQLAGYSFITIIIIIIFNRGQSKEPDSQAIHTLLAIGLKLLLEMIFALIWFVLVKKNSIEYVIVFFVLYLAFTLFSIFYILKTLKNKHLKTKLS
jgi:succinate-acetate transporter protein